MLQSLKKIIKSELSFFLITPAFIWQAVFLVLPIIFVIGLGFCTGTSQNLFQSFTLSNFKEVVHLPQLLIIIRSITLASVTAWACLILAFPISYFLALHTRNYKFLFLFLVSIPFFINLLVQVYAWFFLLERNGLLNDLLLSLGLIQKPANILNSYPAIYIVMFHIYLPFMIMPIFSILEKIDKRLLEASYDLGASFRQTFWHVILPLAMPGVRSGFFLVYVTSFGEYVIPALLGGARQFFVGTLISEYFFIGKDWHVGSAFICISCVCLLFTVLVYHIIFTKIAARSHKVGRKIIKW